MPKMKIKARVTGKDPIEVTYDLGENLDDLVEKSSAEVVYGAAKANMVISLQDIVRSGIRAGDDAKKIQKSVTAWVPGVKRRGKSEAEKAQAMFAKLDPETRAEILANIASAGE